MKVNLDCIPCFMRQALEAARMATDNERMQEDVLRGTATVMVEICFTSKPPEIAHKVHSLVRDITGNSDPYREVKERDNKVALKMYPWLKEIVEESDDRLYTAVKLAAAGNIIDYGVNHVFDLKATIEDVLGKEFSINHYDRFKNCLDDARNIIYLADNAGEIVFDRVLIEELGDKKVKLVVKGGPIINDATIDDVKACGLEGKVKVDFLGNGTLETGPERTDQRFLQKLRNADLVLSKGQGNYEGLSNEKYIYFLLMAKCPLIARDVGVRKGDIVFCRGGRR